MIKHAICPRCGRRFVQTNGQPDTSLCQRCVTSLLSAQRRRRQARQDPPAHVTVIDRSGTGAHGHSDRSGAEAVSEAAPSPGPPQAAV